MDAGLPDRIPASLQARSLSALIIRLLFGALRLSCSTEVHRVKTGLQYGKPVALIAITRLLVRVLATSRINKDFRSYLRP